jgi:hypothetical protein
MINWIESACDEFYAESVTRFRGAAGFAPLYKDFGGGSFEDACSFLKDATRTSVVLGKGSTLTLMSPTTAATRALVASGFSRKFVGGKDVWFKL